MQVTVKYGEPLDFGNEEKEIDSTVSFLLEEIISRQETMREQQAHIENFPLGNEYEPSGENKFTGMEQLRDISRNNYAKVIVDAVTSKCGVEGFRTAVSSDEKGDMKAMELFERDDMGFAIQDAIDLACTYRKSYLYVDPVSGRQRVFSPNNAAVLLDSQSEPVAAVVMSREFGLKRDVLRVFMRDVDEDTGEAEGPLRGFVATREIDQWEHMHPSPLALKITGNDAEIPLDGSLTNGWVWWKPISGMKTERVPVTVLKGKDNKNEFEDANDTISRINHMVWQRVLIATMQAFRQRAIKGDFPKRDIDGKEIDYGSMFEPGPGALWQLPANAELWESSQADIMGLLEAVRADEKALGAQTKTPMNHFSDSVNNSAEGAASQKEAYYDKIEDRRKRFGSRMRRHMSILMEVNGEKERAKVEDLEVIWTPIESLSLNERTAAFASLKGQGLAIETALREGMMMTPGEIKRAIEELNKEVLRQAMAKAVKQQTPLEKSASGASLDPSFGGQPRKKQGYGNTSETLIRAKQEGRKQGRA